MGEVKHAPGPWCRRAHGMIGQGWTVYGQDRVHTTATGDRLTISQSVASVLPAPDREANARLIASAPDLLEALDWLLASIEADPASERYPGDREERLELARASARAAIAKATGPDA